MRKKNAKSLASLSTLATVMLSTSVFASFSADVTPSVVSDLSDNVYAVLGAIQWIGFIVGIAMCIWIGIKYLTSGAGKKAEVKSTMIPWLVGAACIALAPTLASAVFKMFAPQKNGG